MSQFRIKQGTTLLGTVTVRDANGAPVDTNTCTFASQVRNAVGQLVGTLPITPSGVPGQATVLVQPADTALWPVGLLTADILTTTSGVTIPTENIIIYVERAVTQL